jgi:hypothetical protein
LLAGAVAGGAGAVACNPFEVIKVQQQTQKGPQALPLYAQFQQIWQQQGYRGFYRGVGLSVLRSIIGNSLNLTVFSLTKEYLNSLRVPSSSSSPSSPSSSPSSPSSPTRSRASQWQRWSASELTTDIVASLCSAFISTVAMNPVEVLRTRVYKAVGDPSQRNTTFLAIARHEGLLAYFKGFWAAFFRLGYDLFFSFFFSFFLFFSFFFSFLLMFVLMFGFES